MFWCVFACACQRGRPACFTISFNRHTLRSPFLLWQPCSGDLIHRDNDNGSESGDDSDSNSASVNNGDGNDDSDGDGNEDDNLPALSSRMAIHSTRRMRGTAPDQLGNNATLDLKGHELRSIGLEVAGLKKARQRVSERTNSERFSASDGVSAKTLQAILTDLKKKDPTLKEKDFLLGVNTLKLYLTEKVMAGRWDCHEQTFRDKWKEVVTAIAALRGEKIKFDPSDFPEDQIFLLTVDGVNFSIQEPRVKNPGSQWYDHKTHSAGVTYLVAVDVRTSHICWIDGPRPGKFFILASICRFSQTPIYCSVLACSYLLQYVQVRV